MIPDENLYQHKGKKSLRNSYQELGMVELLLYLQVNKLDFYSLMAAGRRYKIPGSEEKDILLLTMMAVARVSTLC